MHGQVQGTKVERSLFFLTCSLHPFPMPQVRSLCWAHAIPHKPESPQCTVSNTDLHKACNIRNNFANPPRPSGECLFLIFHRLGQTLFHHRKLLPFQSTIGPFRNHYERRGKPLTCIAHPQRFKSQNNGRVQILQISCKVCRSVQ